MTKVLYEKETGWGWHEVIERAGKFVAKSMGHGGAKGYYVPYDTKEEAIAHVDKATKPLPEEDKLVF